MDILGALRSAALKRQSVQFEYSAPEKVHGLRVGNPHAGWANSSTGNLLVHIMQTEGVSDSGGLPRFGTFKVQHIQNVVVLHDRGPFEPDPKYNRHWSGYANALFLI